MKDKNAILFQWLASPAGLSLVLAACGGSPSTTNPTPTPVATQASTDWGPKDYNLEKFAKVTANSELNDDYAATNVIDGVKGTAPSGPTKGLIWRPASNLNGAYLRFEWNSQVKVSEVRIFDNPYTNQQVLKGEVRFENSKDTSKNFTPASFGALPDDAASHVSVRGPSDPITALTVHVLDHKFDSKVGDQAGISEVVIGGKRVEETISSGNITPFGRVSAFSSVAQTFYAGYDTGPFRTTKAKDDGSLGTSWASAANGSSAFIEFEFDRTYTIESVELHDRPKQIESGVDVLPHFTKATIRFQDSDKVLTVTKDKDAEVASGSPDSVASKKIRIELTETVDGPKGSKDTGLENVVITGKFEPSE